MTKNMPVCFSKSRKISPHLLLRQRYHQDGGHHSPQGEESALQAGRGEVQEGVKVKFANDYVLAHYFTVSHRSSTC